LTRPGLNSGTGVTILAMFHVKRTTQPPWRIPGIKTISEGADLAPSWGKTGRANNPQGYPQRYPLRYPLPFGAGSNEQNRPGQASALSDTPRSEPSLHRARQEEDTGRSGVPRSAPHDRALSRVRLRRLSSVVAEARRVGRGSAGLEGECLEHSSSGREPRRLQPSSIAADGALRPRGLWGTDPAAWGSLQVRMCLIRPLAPCPRRAAVHPRRPPLAAR
jgi:hypothetical protein